MTIKEAFKAMIETGEYKYILPIAITITAIYGVCYAISALL